MTPVGAATWVWRGLLLLATLSACTLCATAGDVIAKEGLLLVKVDPQVIIAKQAKIRGGEGQTNPDLDQRKGTTLSTKCVSLQGSNFGFYLGDSNKGQGISELPCNEGSYECHIPLPPI